MSLHHEIMYRLLSIVFFLFALAVLPLQAWATGPMSAGIDTASQAASVMAAAHCSSAPDSHRPADTSANHHHDFCCQAPLAALLASTLGTVPLVSPQDSRHEAHYTSYHPDSLSPPPRA